MEQKQIEDFFISNADGSSTNFQDTLSKVIEQKSALPTFLEKVFNILFTTENITAFKQSLIAASFLLISSNPSCDEFVFETFSEGLRNKLSENLIIFLLEKILNSSNNDGSYDDSLIYIAAQLLCSVLRIEKKLPFFLEDFFSFKYIIEKYEVSEENEENKSSIFLCFKLSIIFSLLQFNDFSLFEQHYQKVLDLLYQALFDMNLNNILKAMTILTSLLEFFPDEKDSILKHIEKIKEICANSPNNNYMTPTQYCYFWKSTCALLSTSAADCNLVSQFHQIVTNICSLTTIPADFKLFPLRAIWGCPEEYDRPIVHEIATLTLKVASEYVVQTNQLPFEFLFVFETSPNVFEHEMIYQFTRQKIVEHLESESQSDRIVGLCLTKYMVLNLPHQVYIDAEKIIGIIEECLLSVNELVLQSACMIISNISISISSNLVDVDTLMPKFIPLLIHTNPDIRFHAIEACQRLLAVARIPIRGISLTVFRLVDRIQREDILRFLMLLGKCITHDDNLETEIAVHFSNFTLAMMDYRANDIQMVSGACFVAECLMSVNEKTHGILLNMTCEVIVIMLQSDVASIRIFGISRIASLMKIFPVEGMKLMNDFREIINKNLELDEDEFSIEIQHSVIDISLMESLSKDNIHPFVPKLLEIAGKWLNLVDQTSFVGSAINALKNLQPVLSKELILETFQSLATIVVNTKDYSIACSASVAMTTALKNVKSNGYDDDTRDEVAKIGYQVGISYIKGEMNILNGVSPIGTDFEFNLLYELSMMVCELFSTPSDIMRVFFPFMCSIIDRHNTLKTEIMIICLVSAIENDSLIKEEIEFTRNFAISLLIDNIPPELMCSEAKLLTALFDKQILCYEVINDRLNVLNNWWEQCNSARYKMKTTMDNIVLLVWKIAFFTKNTETIPGLVLKTLDQFPPDDVNLTPEMIRLLNKCIENDQQAPVCVFLKTTRGLMKILTMTQMVMRKRGVSQELIDMIRASLRCCCRRDQAVQKYIIDFANKSESRKVIFQEFVG